MHQPSTMHPSHSLQPSQIKHLCNPEQPLCTSACILDTAVAASQAGAAEVTTTTTERHNVLQRALMCVPQRIRGCGLQHARAARPCAIVHGSM